MDRFDLRILNLLKDNADLSLSEIGQKIGIFSPSAISKRIHELKNQGYIKKSVTLLDYEKLGYDFLTVTFIRTRYEKNYAQTIGEKLKQLPNVVGIYFILGDIDFILLTVNQNRKQYLATMEKLTAMEEIERSDSRVVAYTVKDIDFSGINLLEEETPRE
ncbi:MAG: Lrp/AsnC family transcriptional regulator [Candidatus Thermoplasmatota archaeon]|nr:Lrp/AsnC family transcriptional regulator [Candidatus Thermoplasmatota archaeon]